MKKKTAILLLALLLLLALGVGAVLLMDRESAAPAEELGNETVETPVEAPTQDAAVEAALAMGTRSLCLAEDWMVLGDDDGIGMSKKWYEDYPAYGDAVTLPGTALDVTDHRTVWYGRTFTPDFTLVEGDRLFVRLSGVTYFCDAWLNGVSLGQTHEGGNEIFYYEITDQFKNGEENTLVLRVVAPSDTAYGQVNTGKPRIQQPVYVYATQDVIVSDLFVQPDCATGDVTLTYTLDNPYSEERAVKLTGAICEDGKSMVIDREAVTVTAPAGQSTHSLTLHVDDFNYWSPEKPHLYTVNLLANGEQTTVTTGFKTLRVDDEGYFELNGERYYIKSTHLVAQYGGSYDTARELELIYQELMYLKSCGFNTVRFLMNGALEQQIALCDRIGLLVYQESPAAWKVTDSDVTLDQFHNLVSSVLKRDRNHVSFGMFGMLNETKNEGNTQLSFEAAVAELPSARELAPHMLFLLSSARWDGERSLGSASNPGSTEWDAYMGQEGDTTGKSNVTDYGYTPGMGDLHLYPTMPYDHTAKMWFDGIGANGRAAFLSEAGAGSQANVIGELLSLQENDVSRLSFEYGFLSPQVKQFNALYEEYGCDQVFSSPENMLIATQELQASQRALLFDYIRSNEKINGYSLTMSTDTGFTGEGVISMYGQYKPDMTEVLQEGWADLRWCINPDKSVYTAGETMTLEILLSDVANVLKEGKEYTVTLRMTGKPGTVWTQEVTVIADGTFVMDAFKGEIPLDIPEGQYTISAAMESGAHPLNTEKTIRVLAQGHKTLNGTICGIGLSQKVIDLLQAHGAVVTEDTNASAILVGSADLSGEQLRALYEKAAGGAQLVFLDANTLRWDKTASLRLPFENGGTLSYWRDWLYHKDHLIFDTDLTDGLPEHCLLDPYDYNTVYSGDYITGTPTPDTLSVLVFSAGITTWNANGVISGYQLGSFDFYEGGLTISALKLVDSCGEAVADRLIVNLAADALAKGTMPAACSAEAADAIASNVK